MNALRKYVLKHKGVAALDRAIDFHSAKAKMLASEALPDKEKTLLKKVSCRVHSDDGMYIPSQAEHYLAAGLSAIRGIEEALNKISREHDPRTILDFPCGYGRVLRFLRVRFPAAEITATELDVVACKFCSRVFSVTAIPSNKNFGRLSIHEKFDLIWCGSLITHIEEGPTMDLLKFFHDHLAPGGLCLFTTHGQLSVEWIQKKTDTYGLSESAQQQVLSQFHHKGYGFGDYGNDSGYGISIVSHERMLEMAHSVGKWDEAYYKERGWAHHQDVYGFVLPKQDSVVRI